jgi:hypothetical protein
MVNMEIDLNLWTIEHERKELAPERIYLLDPGRGQRQPHRSGQTFAMEMGKTRPWAARLQAGTCAALLACHVRAICKGNCTV